jgi:hypothetical protein
MTLDQCDNTFDVIRSAESDDILTNALRSLFAEYPLLEFDLARSSVFWRGQRCDSCGYTNVSRLSYPPAAIARQGRLNDEGAPCLYAAQKVATVLAELEAQPGEYIHVIGFKIRPSETIRVFTIGDLFHVHKTGYMRTFGADPGGAISRTINSYDFEKAKALLYIDAFLGALLADGDAKTTHYLKTRRLAVIAYQHSQALGMFYPSVQDHVGMNFAMLPHAYDTKTNVICSQIIRISKRHLFGFYDSEVCLEATSIDGGGNFCWRKPESQKVMFCFGLIEEEKRQLVNDYVKCVARP